MLKTLDFINLKNINRINMDFIITLIIWAACSFACYKLAESKNRNAPLAACLGVLFGLFALIVYACLSKKEEKI